MATLNVSDLNRQGKVFTGANVASKNVIAVTTSMTGLILHNPIGSNKKLVLIDAGFVWVTAATAVHNIGIAMLVPQAVQPAATLTASGSPASAADGSGNVGSGVTYEAAVLAAAPVARRWFGGATYASAAGNSPYMLLDRVDGSLILVPGATLCLCAVTTTAAGMGSFTWAEVPA